MVIATPQEEEPPAPAFGRRTPSRRVRPTPYLFADGRRNSSTVGKPAVPCEAPVVPPDKGAVSRLTEIGLLDREDVDQLGHAFPGG